jgi:hypothetical protein
MKLRVSVVYSVVVEIETTKSSFIDTDEEMTAEVENKAFPLADKVLKQGGIKPVIQSVDMIK